MSAEDEIDRLLAQARQYDKARRTQELAESAALHLRQAAENISHVEMGAGTGIPVWVRDTQSGLLAAARNAELIADRARVIADTINPRNKKRGRR